MADSYIALTEMIVKERELRPPQSYSDAFDILGDREILDKEFAYSFTKIADFRNLLINDYEIVEDQKFVMIFLKKYPM